MHTAWRKGGQEDRKDLSLSLEGMEELFSGGNRGSSLHASLY